MSNEIKHTPGPWAAKKGVGWYVVRIAHSQDDNFAIAVGSNKTSLVDAPTGDDAEAEANARLIAAAPDLLEALEMLSWLEQFCDDGDDDLEGARTAARAAIAKARGE
jgi:hypothetical protein